MYGTRDAAQAWQEEYEETLKEFKLNQGLASPCHFSRQQTGTNVLVHGDDFVVLARRGEASVVRKGMEKKYSVEVQMIGPRHDDPKEMKVLNRTVRWTREGISYEADEKHAEKLIKSCGVVEGATAVTPRCPGHVRQGRGGAGEPSRGHRVPCRRCQRELPGD